MAAGFICTHTRMQQFGFFDPDHRPQNIMKMLPSDWGRGYPNVWLGMTAENQMYFDQRWVCLQDIPAWIKFVSYEPALGPLRLPKAGPLPAWLISGGESGGGARPLDPQWISDVIDDCHRRGVAPFHKQWGTLPLVRLSSRRE